MIGFIPGGRLAEEIDPAVPAAVVDIFAVIAAVAPWVTVTDAGTEQAGPVVTEGVIAQVRLTVPLNDPAGVTERLKDAVCPAAMVAEFEDPDAGDIEKSGTAAPVPDTTSCCEPVPALSATMRLALDPPVAVGANATLIVQLSNGSTVVQLLDCLNFPSVDPAERHALHRQRYCPGIGQHDGRRIADGSDRLRGESH
jgi:hypothetical protein